MGNIIQAIIGALLLAVGSSVMAHAEYVPLYLGGCVATLVGLAIFGGALVFESHTRVPAVLIRRRRFGRVV